MDRNLYEIAIPAGHATVAESHSHVRHRALFISLLLHAAVLLSLVYQAHPEQARNPVRFFPVELISAVPPPVATPFPVRPQPPERQSEPVVPQRPKSPPQMALPPPSETPAAPQTGSEPVPQRPKDELQSRLEAFAKLALPGYGSIVASGDGKALGTSAYDVKDFVRAQVERRWNVDIDAVANRNITVSIHLVLTPDGTIKTVEIVNDQRANADYHSLALSARNAVILSSPIALPIGTPASALDMVLTLSPKDALK